MMIFTKITLNPTTLIHIMLMEAFAPILENIQDQAVIPFEGAKEFVSILYDL